VKTRIAWIIALLAVLGAIACGGTTKGDKFTRDCQARGGHVVTTKKGGSTVRICDPPANGGWQ
jgi:hypothetical protein